MPRPSLTVLYSRLREPLKRLNRSIGLFVACALLLMVGSLAVLAHGGTPATTHNAPVSRQPANTTGMGSDSTYTETTEPGGSPTHGPDSTPHSIPTFTMGGQKAPGF